MKASKFRVADLLGALGKKAPFDLAESWDNVGLIVGDPDEVVSGVVVAVNLGPEALAEAEKVGANVIVCHHPPVFKATLRFTRSNHPHAFEALRRGYSVIAMHTNFDLASDELSRKLALELGLEFSTFLAPRGGGSELPSSKRLGKFITYVPAASLDALREAVCKAGAGAIGDYTQCSFSWEGEGTFQGGSDSKPTVGKAGRLEKSPERRLEVVFPWRKLEAVVQAARSVHPYEEMAYDVLELAQPDKPFGYGFIAEPRKGSQDLDFNKLVDNVKEVFQLRHLTVTEPNQPSQKIQRVAFSPGSGSAFVHAAAAKGADVYICGEVGYHQMLEARTKGLSLLVIGHSYSERFFLETVAEWCDEKFEKTIPVKKVFEIIHSIV